MDHKLQLGDEINSADKPGSSQLNPPEMKEYEVVAESGLFKNGKQYNKGEKIMLIEKSAAAFLANNDIK